MSYPLETLRRFIFGDTAVEYRLDPATGLVGLRIYPEALRAQVVEPREWFREFEHACMGANAENFPARPIDSLVQAKVVGDDYATGFAQGYTLRNGATTLGLKYVDQEVREEAGETVVVTRLRDELGRAAEHHLAWRAGDTTLRVRTVFRNDSAAPLTLELLSSFSLGELTPFDAADAPNRLRVHRLRSAWSAEGRLDTRTVEELNLERSWQGHAVRGERFGQVGSMPVKGFFPFAAVEDIAVGVTWGAQLAWLGSWQMEFYRQSDALNLSGGLADREFGHWTKTLAPGESFTTPEAILACVAGDLDALCHRLTAAQQPAADTHPAIEADLPIICNEFCTTWGNPTHGNLEALAKRLAGSPVRYLVIDAGWYGEPGSAWWNAQGDWIASPARFPQGLGATAGMIRDHGLVPGLWFEFEVAGADSAAFRLTDHQLKRDGFPVTTTRRHFWDFRDPWVHDYLAERVIALLRDGGFGYAKFDYNETIGLGVDGAESLGEGLRQHLEAVGGFYDRIRRELPELVIEICSSGGHRLEPSMLARGAMASFSDAHESLEIPIIAANLHRVLLPRQNQLWAVLRAADNQRRLTYSLAATFLGRMCLSGDLHDLSAEQWAIAQRAMDLYARVAPIIKGGRSFRHGPTVTSYRHPAGWQAVLRVADDDQSALAVVHTFADPPAHVPAIPLPLGGWQVRETFASHDNAPVIKDGALLVPIDGAFDGAVIHLSRA